MSGGASQENKNFESRCKSRCTAISVERTISQKRNSGCANSACLRTAFFFYSYIVVDVLYSIQRARKKRLFFALQVGVPHFSAPEKNAYQVCFSFAILVRAYNLYITKLFDPYPLPLSRGASRGVDLRRESATANLESITTCGR